MKSSSTHSFQRISALYREREQKYAAQWQSFRNVERWLSLVRTLLFLPPAACFVAAWLRPSDERLFWLAASGLAAIPFLAAVIYHDYVLRHMRRYRELSRINQEASARLERQWSSFPVPQIEVPPQHEAVVRDLDVMGRASLLQLINRAHTAVGLETLRDWLLEPATVEEVLDRQHSVTELAPQLDLREELSLRGRALTVSFGGPAAFIRWAEGSRWLHDRPWLSWLSRLLPMGLAAAALLWLIGLLPIQICAVLVLIILMTNAALSVALTGTIHDIFNQVSTRTGEVEQYLALFALMYRLKPESGKLAEIQRQTTDQGGGVLQRLRMLALLMRLAHLRSPLQFVAYLALQSLLLWDFHVLALLEQWQRRYGLHVRAWFEALGQFEALASLASLAHDHPDWVFPVLDPSAKRVEGQGLGHPLLHELHRVANDVTVGPPGKVLLVTGSNMSGKSTLLRAIGVNVLLAQSGSVVCAASMRLPPLQVATSMRISDSLADGVSFFMAELRRLKQIVDQAIAYRDRDDQRLLYLLDEILQGTNSRERHIAVQRVVSHLIEQGAIGAISTHDLELASSEELKSACQPVYFTERLHTTGPQRMTFDYILRPGLAPTTNALTLLEIVGLD